jgi:alanine racemase
VGRAEAQVHLGAIAANAARMRPPGARLCAVVKADGYGHGAVPAARAALRGGAEWLAVATADEAAALRAGGVPDDVRVLVVGALTPAELRTALDARADVVAWSEAFLDAAGPRAHVKLDTGMGRLGTRDADLATRLAERAGDRLAGLMTHFATADEREDAFFGEQLGRFRAWAEPLRREGVLLHAANSAATLREPAAHFDMVRAGVALYGLDPFGEDAAAQGLRPALTWRSWVAAVKPCAPGESAGYGRRFVAEAPTELATVPVGYGDGYRRALTNTADVVIGGRRFPLAGTVSMDNVTVDLGLGHGVRVGDPVTLLGDGVSAEELAQRLGTINYEVTCGISARVPRAHTG